MLRRPAAARRSTSAARARVGAGAAVRRFALAGRGCDRGSRRLWWVVPLLVQSRYGVDFLRFTEQPGTIWSHHEPARVAAADGLLDLVPRRRLRRRPAPVLRRRGVMLFGRRSWSPRCSCPALALAGFAWTRRWRYGPFFLLLVLVGLLVMVAGFPEGTPLRRGVTFTYNHVVAVQFLRTTYKAGPLVALGLALPRRGARRPARCAARRAGAGRRGAGRCCSSRPGRWSRGRALDDQLMWERDPAGLDARRPTLDARAGDGRARGAARAAVRALRLGRDGRPDPAGAHRPPGGGAQRVAATPTCTPPTCSGRSTRSCSSAAAARASWRRCSTCWAPARWSRAPTTTAAQRRRAGREAADVLDAARPPDRGAGAPARAEAARRRDARRAASALPQVRAYDRPARARLVRVERRGRRAGGRRLGRRARGARGARRAARAAVRSTPAT